MSWDVPFVWILQSHSLLRSADKLLGQKKNDFSATAWISTWFNLAWIVARCKYAVDLPGVPQRLHQWFHNAVAPFLERVGDTVAPHRLETLVESEHANAYLQALDTAYNTTGTGNTSTISWENTEKVRGHCGTAVHPFDTSPVPHYLHPAQTRAEMVPPDNLYQSHDNDRPGSEEL